MSSTDHVLPSNVCLQAMGGMLKCLVQVLQLLLSFLGGEAALEVLELPLLNCSSPELAVCGGNIHLGNCCGHGGTVVFCK